MTAPTDSAPEPGPAAGLPPLRETEDIARAILGYIDEVVYIVRPMESPLRSSVEYVSERAREVTGFEPAAFREDPELWFRLLHPEDVPAVEVSTRAVLERREGCTRVYRLRNGETDEYRWVEDRIVPMLDAGGVITGLVGAARDITGRKRSEEALLAREEHFRALIENATDGIALLGADGKILYSSPSAARISGYSAADLVGREFGSFVHPDDMPSAVASFAALLREPHARHVRQFRYRHRSGSWRWVETVSANLLHQPTVEAIVVNYHDITERKAAERALEARARQQAAVARLGHRALAESDLQALMNETVALVADTLGVEYAKVLELLPDGRALLLRAGVGWQEGLVGQATVASGSESQAGFTLRSGGSVVVADLQSETRFEGPPLLRQHGVVSGISVAIHADERPFGVLGAHTTQRREFTADDAHFLESVAHVLAAAVLRQRQQVVRAQLIERVLSIQEAERRHLARELHDDVGQLLTGLKLGLETCDQGACGSAAVVVNQLIARVRDISMGLRPPMLDDLGLVPALLWLFEQFATQAQLRVDFQQAGAGRRFPREVETAVFRIVQEALTNVARHACVRVAEVRVWANADQVGARIEDHGCGFDVGAVLAGPTGGLAGMRERAELLGGRLAIESAAGSGARLSVELPVASQAGP